MPAEPPIRVVAESGLAVGRRGDSALPGGMPPPTLRGAGAAALVSCRTQV